MIDLDPFSILVTVLYVGLLYLVMSYLFFGPILRILHERRTLIAGRLEEAQKRMIQVDKKTAEYEQALRVARAESYRKQEVSREEALAVKGVLVAKAKAEAEASVQEAKVQMQQQAANAKKRLESEADSLAENLTATLLKG